jgi:hypothetical protein
MLERVANLLGKVGIVGGLGVIGSQVDDLVPGLGQIGADFLLERKACVIGTDDKLQSALLEKQPLASSC